MICNNCVMDTSDPDIEFNDDGVCIHCIRAEKILADIALTQEESDQALQELADKIRNMSKGLKYDCVLGVSGGVDSSYTAYLAHKMGLKTLIVHCDNGWNSDIAVSNINKIVNEFGFDLITHVLNWEEFRDTQRAYIKASVVDIEVTTDHSLMAAVYKIAKKNGIKAILSGSNSATEHCMPKSWFWKKQDLRNLKSIHKKYGSLKLQNFPTLSSWQWLVARKFFIEYISVLNYANYKKQEAMQVLEKEIGWKNYGEKHYESVFTKFYQSYILPVKFGIDKRKAHLSCLIRNGEISREEALAKLKELPYNPDTIQSDREYVLKKLGFTEDEFDEIMKQERVPHTEFPSDQKMMNRIFAFASMVRGRA